jgi:hypothetical protein
VKKWKDQEQKEMDECRAERKGQRHRQAKKRERIKESRYNRKYERCMTEEVSGERECKRKKNDDEI